MSMPRVAMIVRMAGMAVAAIVTMVMSVPGHDTILPARKLARPSSALIRHFDTVFTGMD